MMCLCSAQVIDEVVHPISRSTEKRQWDAVDRVCRRLMSKPLVANVVA